MAQYKDKKNVGASTADDILNIAELQGDENNGCCVRLTDEKADEVVEKLAEHGICGKSYFNKEKSQDRSYGDLYVSRIKDNGYVWVLILYARRGCAGNDEKYADYLVQKGDRVAKSDVIALSASYEKPISNNDAGVNNASLLNAECYNYPSVYLTENCMISTDISVQDACSCFGNELAALYEPCMIEMPTESSTGYQRLHPDFKYAYLKEADYNSATRHWVLGAKMDLNGNGLDAALQVLVEKIKSANSQLLSTVYNHSGQNNGSGLILQQVLSC